MDNNTIQNTAPRALIFVDTSCCWLTTYLSSSHVTSNFGYHCEITALYLGLSHYSFNLDIGSKIHFILSVVVGTCPIYHPVAPHAPVVIILYIA